MTFFALRVLPRTIYLIWIFCVMCGCLCLFTLTLSRKALPPKIFSFLAVFLTFPMLVLYCGEIYCIKRQLPSVPLCRWLCRVPVEKTIPFLSVITLLMIFMAVRQIRQYGSSLTKSAIKESLDNITTGLCFYYPNGRVILANHTMYRLANQLLDSDLQNADLFWTALREHTPKHGAVRLSSQDQPVFRLPDGAVWHFTRQALDGFYQLTAADTTKLYQLTETLHRENEQLAALNSRLQTYHREAEALARARERLEIKSRIHRDLGQALTSAHRYLLQSGEDIRPLIPILKNKLSAAGIRTPEPSAEEDGLAALQTVAAQLGIAVRINGPEPEPPFWRKLVFSAAVETMTNAVRHGKAAVFSIDMSYDGACHRCRFSNNGIPPRENAEEGGGLRSLRKKIELSGGSMDIRWSPAFSVTITAPEQEEIIP